MICTTTSCSYLSLYELKPAYDYCLSFSFRALAPADGCICQFQLGVVFDDTAYLRDPWNVLDALSALTTLISVAAGNRWPLLHIFRVLRALRLVGTAPRLKVTSFFVSFLEKPFEFLAFPFLATVFAFARNGRTSLLRQDDQLRLRSRSFRYVSPN